jgi:hypothetical protein
MTRNQLLPNVVRNWSGLMFSVDSGGNITPTAQQNISRGQTILTQAATGGNTTFSGHVCAQQNEVCQCSTLVDNVSSGNHMALGTGYTVKSTAPLQEFELYAITDSGPVPGATNGDIRVNT